MVCGRKSAPERKQQIELQILKVRRDLILICDNFLYLSSSSILSAAVHRGINIITTAQLNDFDEVRAIGVPPRLG